MLQELSFQPSAALAGHGAVHPTFMLLRAPLLISSDWQLLLLISAAASSSQCTRQDTQGGVEGGRGHCQ